jgi:hypothetical protein
MSLSIFIVVNMEFHYEMHSIKYIINFIRLEKFDFNISSVNNIVSMTFAHHINV